MSFVFKADNITCKRGGRQLFAPVSFALGKGDALVIKGANGSGKSTLLRTLAGLIPSCLTEFPASLYLGHSNALHGALNAAEHIDFWRALEPSHAISTDNILKTLGLFDSAKKATAALSQGQKRRLSFARLLLHPAELWLLDEPQAALDDAGQILLLGLIKAHRAKGGMVVIASHDALAMDDVKTLVLEAHA